MVCDAMKYLDYDYRILILIKMFLVLLNNYPLNCQGNAYCKRDGTP